MKEYGNTIRGGKFSPGAAPITFSDKDLESVDFHLVDPLIIKLRIANAKVLRVVVDRGR